jgi:hypothetical protein
MDFSGPLEALQHAQEHLVYFLVLQTARHALLLVPAQLAPMDSGKMVLLAMLAVLNALLA